MSIGLLFWILMILWFFSWMANTWAPSAYPWAIHGGNLLFFVLLFLLGWHDFGFVIHADLETGITVARNGVPVFSTH